MATRQTNPLELYEIVARIGRFIPVFSTEQYPKFTPKDLVAVTQVSRLWHKALSPLLWSFYSGTLHWNKPGPPIDLIVKNSTHIRYFESYGVPPSLAADLQCCRLTHLSMSGYYGSGDEIRHETMTNLIAMNRKRLKQLCWHGRYTPTTLDVGALTEPPLQQLEMLSLSSWNVYNGRLAKVLDSVSGTLKHLNLNSMHGIRRGDFDNLTLPHVTDVVLGFGKDPMLGLEDVFRSVPNVQRITLHSGHHLDAKRIAQNIRECCPKVQEITIHSPIEDEDLADIIASCPPLTLIMARMHIGLSDKVTQAILGRHTESLESLEVQTEWNSPPANVSNLARVLHTCHRLKSLHFQGMQEVTEDELSSELLARPWACQDLECLHLKGFKPNRTLFLTNGEDEASDSGQESEDEPDRITTSVAADIVYASSSDLKVSTRTGGTEGKATRGAWTKVSDNLTKGEKDPSMFPGLLFLHLESLGKMVGITLNHVEYKLQ
ncbi:hypothetical protein BGZ52_000558 [Haplosporangium bisporale]|nr:hypothetical protein BGZ52_000558 [Haplosporangium bisporale]KAF9215921.1 hypothetical protein BGZ59_011648 [Podila verticillata]KAI9234984.1 MAG: hypothetical protein BYD32DRAFT_422236 [Podila humilis]KFH64028.1 hypothetical protein MVEG_09853 [Podila verticillata NRRL 6337]